MISYTLPAFDEALGVPYEGQSTFTHEWSLDALARSSPSDGKYAKIPLSPEEIRSVVQQDRDQPEYRVHQGALIPVSVNQILTKEIVDHMKPMTEIIRENVFCLGGNRDHVPSCLSHILYCVAFFVPYNLAYYMAKKMEFSGSKPTMVLPYGILLTRLFRHVMHHYPVLNNVEYALVDPVMYPLTQNLDRRTRSDYGSRRSVGLELRSRTRHGSRRSVGSSSFTHRPSSNPNDDDVVFHDEGTSRDSTPSPVSYVNSLPSGYPQVFHDLPPEDRNLDNFSERQTQIMNMQHQLRDESRGAWKSIGKILRKLMGKK